MNWIITNFDVIFTIATSVVSTASLVAALTPSPRDDQLLSKIRKFIDVLALNVGNAKRNS